MKNEKGITLTSLIFYVIGMLIMVGIISTLTTFFYKNIDSSTFETDATSQYTKFTSIFMNEINDNGNSVVESKTYIENEKKVSYIIFSSGNQYTFMEENNSIYKNNIVICQNIDKCEFSWSFIDSTYIINVEIEAGNINRTGENSVKYTIIQ